jgi:site-specific DNA-methyltransferase (adenine-specific)
MIRRNQVIVGDVRQVLATLAPASVDCIVTSPPYFALRNYGMTNQMGQEASVDDWVDELRLVARGLAGVLRPTGSLWLNLGDSYSRHSRYGASPKNLLLGPERLVLALQADGWVVRNKVVWAKTNPQPSSVTDRLTATWEVVYFLVRQQRYRFDLDAIRISHRSNRTAPRPERQIRSSAPPPWAGPLAGNNSGLSRLKSRGLPGHPLGKNPGDVWPLATAGFREAHFAVFPERLIEPSILASCPERICVACDAPWQLQSSSGRNPTLQPFCTCRADWRAGLVLDPFMGSGTVGVVAERHRRDWLGIELNPAFARMARRRIESARADGDQASPRSEEPKKGERHAA